MAENKEKKDGPKDITPSPMDSAQQKKTESEGGVSDPAEQSSEQEPQDLKGALKTSLIDSRTMNTVLQMILIVIGLYGLFLGFKGQELMPIPAAAGMFCFMLASLFDIYISRKFNKEKGVGTISKFVLSGVFLLLMAAFIIEVFKKFDLPTNKLLLALAFVIVLLVFIIQFIMYTRKNKEKIVSNIQLLSSFILAVLSLLLFYFYYVVPAFLIAGASIVLLIMSFTKDPIKDDGSMSFRLVTSGFILISFLLVLAYASTIFFIKPIDVTVYGKVTPAYKTKPVNLVWSGDSWSFAFNLFDTKKKEGTVNILNSLSMGINTLPPKKDQEAADNEFSIKLPLSKAKKADIEKNLAAEKDAKKEIKNEVLASEEIKLPRYIDEPIFNNKGNFLVFSGGETQDGPRNIWGVSLTLTLLEMEAQKKANKNEKELTQLEQVVANAKMREEMDKRNMPIGKPKVLIADINKIIDMDCKPLTHKTAWSKNGKEFCFNAADKNGVYNVWKSNVIEQFMYKVTKGDNKIMPLWSPSGDKILYCTKTDSYTYLKISDIDGKNSHELDVRNNRDKNLFPLWNSSQSKVIYLKKGKLIIMNANATESKRLGKESLTPSPYWMTEKEKKVTLEFTESGNIWRIFTINPNGKKNKQIFVEACDTLTQPKWSYDGKAIVTGANYKTESALWRLNSDGTFKTKLYTTKHNISELEWSPTSEKLAFIVKKKAIQSIWFDAKTNLEELWVINNDGTIPVYLYTATGSINHMSWDDQGKRIAFDETYSRIYFQPKLTVVKIVHTIGAELWDLLPYEFYGESPTWSNDGQVIAYISWRDFWMQSPLGATRIWIAQLQ